MEFFETRGGHEFYYGTMPKIAKALEESAKALTENTKAIGALTKVLSNKEEAKAQKPESTFPWATQCKCENEAIDKYLENFTDKRSEFICKIATEILSDSDGNDKEALDIYRRSSNTEKAAIDAFLISICGWSLNSLLRAVEEKESEEI